ncbi:MAG: amino-acid N-acetyltransferase [Porticoccaceae bacterium]
MTNNDYVRFFRGSSPYINAHRHKTFVVSLGGEALHGENFHRTIHDLSILHSLGIRLVVVHGARPQINQRCQTAGVDAEFASHLRVTDSVAMECVREAVGAARFKIEAEFSMGLPNSPMHGAQVKVVGGNFVVARPVGVLNGTDFLQAGEVRRVDAKAINEQLGLGAIVLVSPVGYSPSGESFNMSYADVAARIAIALEAEKLIMLAPSEQQLLDDNNQLRRSLSLDELALERAHASDSERAPLLGAAYQALRNGVARIHLVDSDADGALLTELFTRDGAGTLIARDNSEIIRPASIEDVGGILELITPLEEHGVLVRRSREALECEISQFSVVVHPEGMLIGCAALYPAGDGSTAELAAVAVHPDFHRRGIASRLLQALEVDARQAGLEQLFVLTTQTAHWFREQGFVEAAIGELPAEKQSLYNYQRNSKIYHKPL